MLSSHLLSTREQTNTTHDDDPDRQEDSKRIDWIGLRLSVDKAKSRHRTPLQLSGKTLVSLVGQTDAAARDSQENPITKGLQPLSVGMELCERARRVQKRFAIENAPHTHTVEAMELYEEAARTLETRREVELAADCYAKCADACLRQKKQLEAAVFWAKSASVGHCPERRERAVASCCAVEAYSEAGYVTAEKDTMFAFEIFRAANEDNKAALCLEKAAERLASAELFERLSETLARDNLTAPNCPRILLRASLCRLVENFKMVDLPRGSWLATPEYRFARDLAECVSAELPDRDNFADYVYDFSQVRQLTLFDLTILQKIHLNIEKIHQDHRLKTERAARKAERRKKREIEARERQLRIQRDFQ